MSKIIKLNSEKYPGYECIVDDEDYDMLMQYNWYPAVNSKNNTVYVDSRIKNTHIRIHRFIMLLYGHDIENKLIDHQDQNGLNNQKENLRICNHMKNAQNGKKHKDGLCVYKGISLAKNAKKYRAKITNIHIGYFDTEKEAALAYNKKAIELFGEYASLNIIN